MNKKFYILFVFVLIPLVFAGSYYCSRYYHYLKIRTVNFHEVKIVLPQEFRKDNLGCSNTEHSLYCSKSSSEYFFIRTQDFDYNLDVSTKEARSEALKVHIQNWVPNEGGVEYSYSKTDLNGDAGFWTESFLASNSDFIEKSLYFFKNGKVYSVGFAGSKDYINKNWLQMERSILSLNFL